MKNSGLQQRMKRPSKTIDGTAPRLDRIPAGQIQLEKRDATIWSFQLRLAIEPLSAAIICLCEASQFNRLSRCTLMSLS